MERYHVIRTLIDRPNIRRELSLPAEIRRVTGVMFFPEIMPTEVPDTQPLGTVGFSIDHERINIVANQLIYKKQPVFYQLGNNTLLDGGFSRHDFFPCNDALTGNNVAVFKYVNRKMIISKTETEIHAEAYAKLFSLLGQTVRYKGINMIPMSVSKNTDESLVYLIYRGNFVFLRSFTFKKEELAGVLSEFYRAGETPGEYVPCFEADPDLEQQFHMKIILRYGETQDENISTNPTQ
jgi:hypothetical protein